jgi:acetyl esterase/lipase
VEFWLAPEHKFPVGIDDSASAARWIIESAARLAIDLALVAIPPAETCRL